MKINYMWVMNTASNYMEAKEDYCKAVHKPWKTMKEYEERCQKVEFKSCQQDKQDEALWAVHAVIGCPYDIMFNAVRIQRKYEQKHNYEKCLFGGDWDNDKRERLFNCLSAKSPDELCGIYSNEFCDGAIRRLELRRMSY